MSTTPDELPASAREYYPFGETRYETGTAPNHTYTDQIDDSETGLMYYGARYYEAGVGRFTSADPAAVRSVKDFLNDPQQLNLYAYARNNPLKYTDPNGQFSWLIAFLISQFYGVQTANSPSDEDVASGNIVPASNTKSMAEAISPGYNSLPGPVKFGIEAVTFGGTAGAVEKIGANMGSGLAEKEVAEGTSTALVTQLPRTAAIEGTEEKVFLQSGKVIDRFGSLDGKWFSEPNVPYSARSLPPGQAPYNKFEVIKPFEVEKSISSPGNIPGQTGFGTQYHSSVSADVLIRRGIIKPL